MARHSKIATHDHSSGRNVEYVSGRDWNTQRNQDVKAFANAADKYLTAHATSKKKARSALLKMGIITPTGRLSKHYK